ncbi:hypothetical protein F0562_027789 [Nyssa sinensis]|uniref:Kinesin motor domain-containing protein n=1 Tax=Nyssa sinensis TaxID=561372 RepID=A0A5J5BAF7_9ASTE|nr:hypothetical protein F0562_027789 [Nyssa sinensis]
MENSETKDSSQCVRVAVNIRPLVTAELLLGCTDCITVVPREPQVIVSQTVHASEMQRAVLFHSLNTEMFQMIIFCKIVLILTQNKYKSRLILLLFDWVDKQVQIGSHAFTFDYVFGSTGYPSSQIFDQCVASLVDALFNGYNGTVLAYGQTGSGKTYTMGTNYNGEEHNGGIIPKVMETIFSRVEAMKDSTEFLIRVSFIEIFKEEVFDLLDPNPLAFSKGDGGSLAKPARTPIQIRETVNGGITLAGVTEAEVRTKEEMASFLLRGSLSRATGSTNMNSQSSRSHAIFTISMEQKKVASCPTGAIHDDVGDDILCAKLHLVDLAGSERAKRTGADGMRFREGIHINKGLLALGNVISALGDEKKRKEGGHIPYRDSKLTRLLQDSLGGNCKTTMIACVSPADTNAEETLNTLKYANRARNIQNKAIINRDPVAAQMQRMRSQIEQLQAELASSAFEELQILKHKISLLEASNAELQRELQERRISCEHLTQRAIDAQVERDGLIMKIESARNGKSWDEIDSNSNQDSNLVKTYVSKIQELEGELLCLQTLNSSRDSELLYLDLDDGGLSSKNPYLTNLHEFSSENDRKAVDIACETEDEELEHSSVQEKLDQELKELDKKLQQKEAEMKQFTTVDTSVIKQHYEKKVQELEHEKRALQKEIEELRYNLANISSTSDDSAQKLKSDYLQKLNILEAQVSELKKKQDGQAQLLRQKQKSDEASKRLQDEIQRIKTHKVQLQQKIKQESEQFRLWKASREKEVLQLKKEGRRNEYEMHKLLALNQRQKMVLQRKTEEAAMATKRLKELLESRKALSRETFGAGNSNGPGIQALMQTIEHELEVTVRVHEVRSEYERQMEERARMAKEVAELKEEAHIVKRRNLSDSPQAMSPGARNSRIFALENMLATSSSALISMGSQLSEAEERERAFSGRGRWSQVRSLAEAKNIMNYLFNLASSSRCSLRDKEVDCREKHSEIKDLKGKIVNLVRQLEMQKAELIRQENLQKLSSKKHSAGKTANSGSFILNTMEGHAYDLRPKDPRCSIVYNGGGKIIELLEDMDTSDSEHSEDVCEEHFDSNRADDDPEWVLPKSGGACCSCSKQSLCKTTRCQCRDSRRYCGISCACKATKCSNRKIALTNEADHLPQSQPAEGTDEIESSSVLASHGAMLLQVALAEKPTETNNDEGPTRKPLSDIGNTLAKSNAPKHNQRKKSRKSVIQLVPVAPPPQPEDSGAPKIPESNTIEADVPLKLPRPRRSAATNSNPLRERNSDQPEASVVNKEAGAPAPGSPHLQARTLDDKENCGI